MPALSSTDPGHPPLRPSRGWFPLARAPRSRARQWWEIAIVLLLSYGASAIWAIVQLIDYSTRETPIGEQSVAMNPARSDRSWLDFTYQFLSHTIGFASTALVCWLLWRGARPHLARLGLTFERTGRDAASGALLVAVIGIPGLGIFFLGRALGWTANLQPSPLDAQWWTVPMLLLAALRAGISEEVIVVGYLFERLRGLGWSRWGIILACASLRATYHLYQGVPAFLGNLAMGVVFGWLYTRGGRLLPLVVAHVLIDTAAFVGYPWAYQVLPGLFGG